MQAAISGSTFVNNEAIGLSTPTYYGGSTNGGAIFNDSSALTISGSTFVANQAVGAPGRGFGSGGAISDFSDLALNVSNSLLIDNQAIGGSTFNGEVGVGGGFGGGLVLLNGSGTVANTGFIGNQAIGGPASGAGSQADIGEGGAISNVNESLTLSDCGVSLNQAIGGPRLTAQRPPTARAVVS